MYISDCSLDSPSSIKESSCVVRAFLLTYPERWAQPFKPTFLSSLVPLFLLHQSTSCFVMYSATTAGRWSWAVTAVRDKGDLSWQSCSLSQADRATLLVPRLSPEHVLILISENETSIQHCNGDRSAQACSEASSASHWLTFWIN